MSDNLFCLQDKVAIITGGMGQLGTAFTYTLIERGVRVAILDIAENPINHNLKFTDYINQNVLFPLKVDITNKNEIEVALKKIIEKWKVPDILVNNAGIDSPPDASIDEVGPFETYPESSFDEVINVNVKGTFLCCQVIGSMMAKLGYGTIINISSIYGLLSPRQDIYEFRRKNGEVYFKPVAYSVSKSAIFNLTKYLATYWSKNNVKVNTLTLSGIFNNQSKEFIEAYCKNIPIGRMANVEEYTGALIFLCSNASSYMTGSNLIIDGGWTAW